MNKIEVLSILESILGHSRQTGEDNYAFYCPFCKHYKKKLEVNLTTYNYHCWVCNPKLGGKNFYYLAKKLANISEANLEAVREYTNTPRFIRGNSKTSDPTIKLPKEFKSMEEEHKCIEYKHAKVFLKKRGITDLDIKKYNIGFCDEGEYSGRIIIPSYSEDRTLNYFVGRTFFDDYLKYKNPKVSRDIIAFENLIDWNNPIIICEGMLDAIAIRRNAVPLLGKLLPTSLKNKIKISNVKEIYVCLDVDAKNDAVKIATDLMEDNDSRNVYLVRLDKKDPSEIGFEQMIHIIKDTPKFDFENLIYTRLFE